ncbi:MAG: hypothetical protein Q9M28_01460 [Mariprofundaceae bacterium]|nr:hypothetical protein [Mariprofundaceae bacterium]
MFCLYISLALLQGDKKTLKEVKLENTMPIGLHQVVSSYARQLFADAIYIKVVVFLGSKPLPKVDDYKNNLYQHFLVIQALHPQLIDMYYLSESSLSWVSKADTLRVNELMSVGMAKKTEEWLLYFFKGFNEFYYLQEPAEAARTLYASSAIESTPLWLGSLATVLAAKGGELRAGLSWLKVMWGSETDVDQKKRYARDIVTFEKALLIQVALEHFKGIHQVWPESLSELVPDFLVELPVIKGDQYDLSYANEQLRLLRPKRK